MLRLPPRVCGHCAARATNPSAVRPWRQLPNIKPSPDSTRSYTLPTRHHLPYHSTRPNPLLRQIKTLSPSSKRRQSQFQPLQPPSPASLGKAQAAKSYTRTRKWLRRLTRTALVAAAILLLDIYAYDECITRSLRTFYAGLVVALDYKLNFRPDPWVGDSVADLHSRSAQRVFDLLRQNGGLYLKIGQAIAMQSAILPPEFQRMFARMFDDAPQNSWREVEAVIREDFGGRSVEDVFGVSFAGEPGKGVMERTARASASVAQVHWARLQDGREVAVKIQKREIARQVGWDLWAFRTVTRIYTWWFDIPLYQLVPYVSERLMLETDFLNEAQNAEKMRALVQGEPRLRNKVYIPEVYHDLSSRRVMTAEWIEGIRLWDKEGITGSWQGGWRKGSPGAGGVPLPPPPASITKQIPTNHPDDEKLKPIRDSWRGNDKQGGLGVSLAQVMDTMVSLFSAQMFLWGLVHCDPHPGNIFIRRLPNGKPELVLIDHGLYITMAPKFRREYALFWRSLMTFDNATIARITREEWGIDAPELFASATLMRPYEGGDGKLSRELRSLSRKEQRERQFELQQKMRQGVRQVLANQDKFPRDLLFIGRNLRIVQGNNQFLGSPVNRVKITGTWASRALAEQRDAPLRDRLREYVRHALFRVVLLSTDLVFYWARLRQVFGWGKGMDDDIEESMRRMAGRSVDTLDDMLIRVNLPDVDRGC